MKGNISRLVIYTVLFLPLISCRGRQGMSIGRLQRAESAISNEVAMYQPPQPPAILTDSNQIISYYRHHYWDNLILPEDTEAVDTVMMVSAFVSFVSLLENADGIDVVAMEELMSQCMKDRHRLDLFSMLSEKVLHDPNSPYREDELYMPVLRARIKSGFYDSATKTRDQYHLDKAMQNRTGHKANDFRYTLKDGSKGSLYGLKAAYTLVFINNPGCTMCRTVKDELESSEYLMELVAEGKMQILAIYPDDDTTEWEEHYNEIPSSWINAYDDGCTIRRDGSYKLDAIPALYLLDRDKTVLLKDATDIEAIVGIIARNSTKAAQ